MTLDEAARELAEATRARYAQPNGTVVIPTIGRLHNRRFWDAMESYERARQEDR